MSDADAAGGSPTDDPLAAFFAAHPHHHESAERWPVQGPMRVRLGLAARLPPAHVSSSVLAIVFDDRGRVLFLWPSRRGGGIAHVLIGGRPEPGETPEQTATREVGEETGWRIEPIALIGYRHFHQPGPRSPLTDRPHPDFVQPIYAARATTFDERLILAGDRIDAAFLDVAEAEAATEPDQRPLLAAAHAAVKGHARATRH